MPADVSSCRSLRYLNLSQNLLAGSIPGSLADLPDLRQLDLQGNSFTGEIPSKFGEFRRLEWISLTGNPYSAGPLPSELGNLLNLEDLWRLNQLRRFDASMNQLTGTIPDELCRVELESLNLFTPTASLLVFFKLLLLLVLLKEVCAERRRNRANAKKPISQKGMNW
ncbi:Receptor-like protein kinase HSL1 [Linum perenne]